jgi:hypothetical protein
MPPERTYRPVRIGIGEWSAPVGDMGDLADFGPCIRLFLPDGSEVDVHIGPWVAVELADALKAMVTGADPR